MMAQTVENKYCTLEKWDVKKESHQKLHSWRSQSRGKTIRQSKYAGWKKNERETTTTSPQDFKRREKYRQ